ncbi:MAG: exopolysaccharide biosynthesis protein [Rhabdochlamydiaceae bacterium]
MMKQSDSSKSILHILQTFLQIHKLPHFTVMDLVDALKERSFGFILLLMAMPNVLLLATIPGLSTIFGGVMGLVSIQVMLRLPRIWLPRNVRYKSYATEGLEKMVKTSAPFLKSIERFLKPRFFILTAPFLEPFLGFISFINSIWITLPIPFGNFFPALAMVVLSLGIIENDGLFIMLGALLSFLVWIVFIFMYSSILSHLILFLGF